ncbi:MAG: DUF4442 domain-containing protein [Desulfobacterales bacterium]|nr:DUF4442 domain-containing protein [Desulfobacterales bacterium]
MKWTPRLLKWGLRFYGPYIGAGIWMETISKDWRYAKVSMKMKWYNRNAVGVHFGGSLYSMVDPHFMLMLMPILGRDYLVWDKRAEIEFIRPGSGKVSAEFRIREKDLDRILDQTSGGKKYFHTFEVDVVDARESLVAKVKKVIYIRKKGDPLKSSNVHLKEETKTGK